MKSFEPLERVFLHYLLNQLPEKEKEALELRIVQDEEFYLQFVLFESELIDKYLYERESFSKEQINALAEVFSGSSKYLEQLKLTATLKKCIDKKDVVKREEYTFTRVPSILFEFKSLFGLRYEIV
ncbi:MAG: hypothetical protein ABL952_01210 [Pyrinomonadaceae bacterium]